MDFALLPPWLLARLAAILATPTYSSFPARGFPPHSGAHRGHPPAVERWLRVGGTRSTERAGETWELQLPSRSAAGSLLPSPRSSQRPGGAGLLSEDPAGGSQVPANFPDGSGGVGCGGGGGGGGGSGGGLSQIQPPASLPAGIPQGRRSVPGAERGWLSACSSPLPRASWR